MRTRADKNTLLLTVTEAALRLGVSRSTLYSLIKTGAVAHVMVGSRIKVVATSLYRYVADHASPKLAAAK